MHYAWLIVALVFTTQFAANAMGFYAFGVVLSPIAEEFEATRTEVSFVPAVMSWAGFVVGPLIGRAVTTIPLNRLLGASALAMGTAFFAMSYATALWQLGLGYALGVSLGLNALSGVGSQSLIVNWFEERRAFALGLAGVGISLAGFVMTPITALGVAEYGWRAVFRMFASAAFVLTPVIWWLAATRPSVRGMLAFGASDAPASGSAEAAAVPAISTREVLTTPSVWLVAVSAGICFMATTAIITHGVSFAQDSGHADLASASFVVSAMAGAAAIAKVLFGWLAEKTSEKFAFVVCIVLHMLGLAAMAVLNTHYAALVIGAAIFGLGYGGVMPLMGALLARIFGPLHFGPVMGMSGPILIIFQSIGAPLLGLAYDVQGSYVPGLWLMAAAMIVPIIAITSLRTDARAA